MTTEQLATEQESISVPSDSVVTPTEPSVENVMDSSIVADTSPETSEEPVAEENVVSSLRKPIENAGAQRTFEELTGVYRDYQLQISKAQQFIKTLTGDSSNPSTLWKLLEIYGSPVSKDKNECALCIDGKVWSIRRTNNRYQWDTDSALNLFKLAYTIQTSSDNSEKQAEAFDSFQCTLEKLLDIEVTMPDDDWWTLIDATADLFRTTVTRSVQIGVLEAMADEMPEILVKALCKQQIATYGLQVNSESEETDQKVVACGSCENIVSDEDFFCRYCGNSLGSE